MFDTLALFLDPALDAGKHRLPQDLYDVAIFFLAYERMFILRRVRQKMEGYEQERKMPMNVIWKGSYSWNHGSRPKGTVPDLIIVHGMGGTLTGTTAWFNNVLAFASSHFGIGSLNATPDVNEVFQYVKLEDAAYGVRKDAVIKNVNQRAYQIEIQNFILKDKKLTFFVKREWLESTAELIDSLCQKMNRRPDRSFILGHTEVDPRKGGCPVGIDVNYIVARAQEIWDGRQPRVGVDQPIVTTPAEQGTLASVKVPVDVDYEPIGYKFINGRKTPQYPTVTIQADPFLWNHTQPNSLESTRVANDPERGQYGHLENGWQLQVKGARYREDVNGNCWWYISVRGNFFSAYYTNKPNP